MVLFVCLFVCCCCCCCFHCAAFVEITCIRPFTHLFTLLFHVSHISLIFVHGPHPPVTTSHFHPTCIPSTKYSSKLSVISLPRMFSCRGNVLSRVARKSAFWELCSVGIQAGGHDETDKQEAIWWGHRVMSWWQGMG